MHSHCWRQKTQLTGPLVSSGVAVLTQLMVFTEQRKEGKNERVGQLVRERENEF